MSSRKRASRWRTKGKRDEVKPSRMLPIASGPPRHSGLMEAKRRFPNWQHRRPCQGSSGPGGGILHLGLVRCAGGPVKPQAKGAQ